MAHLPSSAFLTAIPVLECSYGPIRNIRRKLSSAFDSWHHFYVLGCRKSAIGNCVELSPKTQNPTVRLLVKFDTSFVQVIYKTSYIKKNTQM